MREGLGEERAVAEMARAKDFCLVRSFAVARSVD